MRNAKYKGKTALNAKYIVEEEQLQILQKNFKILHFPI